MTARGYEQDTALRNITKRVLRLELKEARNRPASGVTIEDPGGFFGGPGGLTLEEVIALIGAGTAPGSFLTVVKGGQGTVQSLGSLGATETIDLANANYFAGTLNANCTIGFTGWTNGKDCQITVELTQNATGGWLPTFSGVTWLGSTPIAELASTVTHVVLFSRDGGTTIYGALLGGGGTDTSLVTVAASGATETIDVSVARTYDVTLTANCTLSLTGAITGEAWFVTLLLRQDGTGSRVATWPGSVTWPGGVTPTLATTAASVDVFTLFTLNGGTNWFGFKVGGGGSVTAAEVATLVAAGGHVHIDNVTFSGDAVTTAFTLPAAPVDAFSVAAYVAGIRTAVTLSGTLLDTMTFGSAPAAATDNIIVDIAAVLV